MTTISYPAKGTGGFPIDKWTEVFEGENGILNDYDGTSCALTRIDAGEIARISPGQVRVGGYVLQVTANHDLTVSTSAATYYIWACYDPALNVGTVASSAGPCTLGISSGAPSTSGGKIYTLLYQIVRGAAQALTAATVREFRLWQGPTLHIPEASTVPSEFLTDPISWPVGAGPYPVGTQLAWGSRERYTLVKSTSGVKFDRGGWTTLSPQPTMGSGFTDRISFGGSFKYRWLGRNQVWLRGAVNNNVARTANSNGNLSPDVTIATGLPTAIRPTDGNYGHAIPMYRNGVMTYWGRVETNGDLLLTHINISGETVSDGTTVEIDGSYIID